MHLVGFKVYHTNLLLKIFCFNIPFYISPKFLLTQRMFPKFLKTFCIQFNITRIFMLKSKLNDGPNQSNLQNVRKTIFQRRMSTPERNLNAFFLEASLPNILKASPWLANGLALELFFMYNSGTNLTQNS